MRAIGRGLWGGGLVLASLYLAVPAAKADVVTRTETGFVVRLASEVAAPPAETWKTILTPAQWWQSQHTFSGDAANLSLDPQVGGCFCEVLPRPEGAPAAQKPGGVQHMRVVYIEPPRAMRLAGALGPLQSEALAATMTITVKPTEKGSRILFEYVVGGFMRYKVEEIAPAVDRMLTAQLASLAGKLGPIAEPVATPPARTPVAPPEDAAPASEAPARPVVPLKGAESFSLPPAGGKAPAKPAAKPDPKPDPAPAPAAPKPAAPALKSPVKASYMPPAKSAPAAPAKASPKESAKAPAKAPGKVPAKAPAKPAPKAPDPEAEAHRDANAAFDAALGAAPAP
jgi:uncharacterized protein YndB with AHSA1/START domain